nr:putative late blight resistance protein homolog R1A-10 isoform X1 [Ipomoea batatas]
MAYAAVTSLMETLYLHFLQSQPRFPLEDLEAQIRLGNENVGLLQQILEAQIGEKEASSKRLRIKACFPRDYGKQQLAWDTTLLTSQLREVGEVKQKIVSLHQNLGLLQQSIEKSEITYDDARVRVMKDLEAQIRDASFKAEERIEMELSAIYLAKDSLHITACLLRLHQIFNEAQKQTRYQISDGNENLGLLQQIVNAQIFEMGLDEKAQNLGLLQRIFEIRNDDAARVVMKDLEEEMRDYERYLSIKAEEWIEMELTTFYLAKDTLLHTTACLLRLHEIFIEAQKQTDYHSNELIRIQTDEYDKQTDYHRLAKVSLLDSFYDFVHLEQLEKLSIRRWMDVNLVMCSIPWATSLPNLKKLSLLKSNILWSELSAISMLPNLEVLKLINACEGSKWETCYGGFHRLKRLVIRKTNLQYWNAVGDHFPMLECLEISDCSRLKEIPRDFVDIITLALIQLSKCGDSVVASAKWIQEEQKSYGNEALLVRY